MSSPVSRWVLLGRQQRLQTLHPWKMDGENLPRLMPPSTGDWGWDRRHDTGNSVAHNALRVAEGTALNGHHTPEVHYKMLRVREPRRQEESPPPPREKPRVQEKSLPPTSGYALPQCNLTCSYIYFFLSAQTFFSSYTLCIPHFWPFLIQYHNPHPWTHFGTQCWWQVSPQSSTLIAANHQGKLKLTARWVWLRWHQWANMEKNH